MHFYDSVAVFERGTHTKKWAPQIGTPPEPEHRLAARQVGGACQRKPESSS